jgi:hypothetical protein
MLRLPEGRSMLAAVGGLGIVGVVAVVLIVLAIICSCGVPGTTNTRGIPRESTRRGP